MLNSLSREISALIRWIHANKAPFSVGFVFMQAVTAESAVNPLSGRL